MSGSPGLVYVIGLWAHVRLHCCKQDCVVRKQVDTNPRLKINQIINFSHIQIFFHCFFFVYFESQNRRPNNIQKTLFQSYKTQIKIFFYPGWAWSGFEQALLLGLAKSIYYRWHNGFCSLLAQWAYKIKYCIYLHIKFILIWLTMLSKFLLSSAEKGPEWEVEGQWEWRDIRVTCTLLGIWI